MSELAVWLILPRNVNGHKHACGLLVSNTFSAGTYIKACAKLHSHMGAVVQAGAGARPASNSYVPRSYTGPVRPAANGAFAPVTPLTGYRPVGGAYYALPAYTSSQYRYTRNRPLLHTCARVPSVHLFPELVVTF